MERQLSKGVCIKDNLVAWKEVEVVVRTVVAVETRVTVECFMVAVEAPAAAVAIQPSGTVSIV